MTAFLLGSFFLIILAVAAVVWPLLRAKQQDSSEQMNRQSLTLKILRDQQGELEQERQVGVLSEGAYEQAHAELQRRLVDELDPSSDSIPAVIQPRHSRRLAFALILLIPLASGLGYILWGNPLALQPGATQAQAPMTAEKIAQMVNKLAARMKENPGDLDGWLKLAQAYKVMGRYADAAEAYAKAEPKVKTDASLLASYAETLGMAHDKGLRGKPTMLIEAALKLNPKEPNALLLAGAAAMERKEFKQAVTYWEQLLPMVEPGSELDNALRDGIERIRSKEGAKPSGKHK
jgi:cytochrome c-type biogenesis protein CcmH